MAKLLVLFDGVDEKTAKVAEWILEGARSVRFAEADLRRLPGENGPPAVARIRPLGGIDDLTGYDAVALGTSDEGFDRISAVLHDAEGLGMRGALANKLGAVFPATDPATVGNRHPLWPLLAPMARYGMILVPPGYAGPAGEPEDLEAASKRMGRRLIDIAGWITHARSHHHH
ncbi:MAG TPA: hypothetical protein VFV33_06725 [Gemmatimonadaceae bacterium]|nr:hypothetical protein [Gemmatimonadaceae bacterium]